MTGQKSTKKRPYQFHGTYGLSKALSSVKDQDQWLTEQGPVGDALKELRAELIEQQGGAERVSPGELMTIEGLVFAHMLMMSAGRFIGEQASPVNKSRRQLFPVVTQWLTLFREVRETAKDLNELRTKRPKPEPLLLADYLNGTGNPKATNGTKDTQGASPAPHRYRARSSIHFYTNRRFRIMAMNAISIGSLINTRLTEQPKRDLSTDDWNLKLIALKKLDPAVLKVATDIDAVQKDTSLSHDGQQKQLAVIGTKAVPAFEWLARMRDAAVNAYNATTHTMLDPLTAKPKGDPIMTFLREQEIRQTIKKDDANTAFLRALETDDVETARAILDAPGAPWVSDDIEQRGEAEYARRTNPTIYAHRASKELLRDELIMLVGVIASWLLSLGADEAVVHATLGE